MGKRSREKKERKLSGEAVPKKEKPEYGAEKILKMIIFVGTCLILFTPLIMSGKYFFPFVGPKSIYFMGLAEIVFFSWLFLSIFYSKYRPRLTLTSLSLIIFTAVLIAATVVGVDPTYSFWSKYERMTGLLMMFHLLAFFLAISSTLREKDWVRIFSVSIAAGVIAGTIALVSKNPSMQQGGTLGNDSFLGTYLLFNLFFAAYLILKSKGILRIYSSFCFLIMAAVLFHSDARAAKLSFLGSLFLLLFLWMGFKLKGKMVIFRILKILGRSLLVLSVISAIVFMAFILQPNSFVRKEIIEKRVGETFGGRFIVWQEAWKGFLQKPWLGWGPENFEYAFDKYYNPCLGTGRCGSDVWYDRAHNIVFDTLVASGVIGFASYLFIFGAVLWVLWQQYKNKNIDFWTAGILSVLLIGYLIQNMTVFDMVSSYMIFYLALGFIGLISPNLYSLKTGLENQEGNLVVKENAVWQRGSILTKELIGVTLLATFFFCMFLFVIRPLEMDSYVIKAFQAQNSKDRLALYKKTLSLSQVGNYQAMEQFTDFTLNTQSEVGKTILAEDYKAELDFLSEQLENNVKKSPSNLRAYLKLGEIYNNYARIGQNNLPQAEMALKKAFDITKDNQQAYWTLAQTKLYEGNGEEALSLTQEALRLEPNRLQSYLILIQVAKIIGQNDLAQKTGKDLIKLDPSQESRVKQLLGIQ